MLFIRGDFLCEYVAQTTGKNKIKHMAYELNEGKTRATNTYLSTVVENEAVFGEKLQMN